MVRRREGLGPGPRSPERLLVLDSGGLTGLARNAEPARAAFAYAVSNSIRLVVPAVVIAESTKGDASDALINRVINTADVVTIGEAEAREATRLKRAAGMTGVEHTIDALVVACATLAGGGVILTSDPVDIRALADTRPDVRVRAIAT